MKKEWWQGSDWEKDARMFFPESPVLGTALVVKVSADDSGAANVQSPQKRLRILVGGDKALQCRGSL